MNQHKKIHKKYGLEIISKHEQEQQKGFEATYLTASTLGSDEAFLSWITKSNEMIRSLESRPLLRLELVPQ